MASLPHASFLDFYPKPAVSTTSPSSTLSPPSPLALGPNSAPSSPDIVPGAQISTNASTNVAPEPDSRGVILDYPSRCFSPPRQDDRAFIIGVAGGTASGKTSLCRQILKMLEHYQTRVAIVAQDSFYKTLTAEEKANIANKNFDEPAAFDWELMRDVLLKLGAKKKAEIPIYDYVTHSRRSDKSIALWNQDVVLFEGILSFHNEEGVDLRSLFDLKIFVETDSDTRLARRVVRDIRERGRSLDSVLYQYERFVKPAFEEYVQPLKRFADVIIPWGDYSNNMASNDDGEWQNQQYPALNMIVEHIRTKLPTLTRRTSIKTPRKQDDSQQFLFD